MKYTYYICTSNSAVLLYLTYLLQCPSYNIFVLSIRTDIGH